MIFRLRTCEGRSVKRFSLTKKVVGDGAFLPAKSQHFVAGYLGNMGQSTHHRLDRFTNRKHRKSSRPIYDAVSSLEEPAQADRLLATLVAGEVITKMLLGLPYLYMRASEWHSGENLAGYRKSFKGDKKIREDTLALHH